MDRDVFANLFGALVCFIMTVILRALLPQLDTSETAALLPITLAIYTSSVYIGGYFVGRYVTRPVRRPGRQVTATAFADGSRAVEFAVGRAVHARVELADVGGALTMKCLDPHGVGIAIVLDERGRAWLVRELAKYGPDREKRN